MPAITVPAIAEPPTDTSPPAAIICPQCGYDLRGIESDRCPECGLDITDAVVARSTLPWAYRRANGRVRSYVRTAWWVIVGGRRFAHEIARPVSSGDAKSFWIVTALLISLPVGAAVVIARVSTPDWTILPNLPPNFSSGVASPALMRGFAWDVIFPTLVGWMMTPISALLPLATALSQIRILPMLLNRKSLPMPQRARAVALAHYAGAPIALGMIFALCVALTGGAAVARGGSRDVDTVTMVAGLATWAILVIALFIGWIRSCGMYAAFTHGGIGRWMFAALVLPVGWVIAALFWLVAVPWVLGLLWIFWRVL